jgi:hypothetical protein
VIYLLQNPEQLLNLHLFRFRYLDQLPLPASCLRISNFGGVRRFELYHTLWAGLTLVLLAHPGYQPPPRAAGSGLRVASEQEELGIKCVQLDRSDQRIHNRPFRIHAVSRAKSIACLRHWIPGVCSALAIWTNVSIHYPGTNISSPRTRTNARRTSLTGHFRASATF